MKKLTTTGWTIVIAIVTIGLLIGCAFTNTKSSIVYANQVIVSTADRHSILYSTNGNLAIKEEDGQLKIVNRDNDNTCIIKLNDELVWVAESD